MNQERLNTAIQRGVDFLAVARNEQGWWSDFCLAAGWSDEWVTGYTGAALAEISPDLAFEAWTLLKTRRSEQDGWGFNARTPMDSDSTIWALRLASLLGQETDPRYRQAITFLMTHLTPEGGLTTYASEPPIRSFIRYPWYLPMWGWVKHPHPCVTAAGATLATLRPELITYLRRMQAEDGHWSAYWWDDPEYATAQATSVLLEQGDPGDQDRIARAVAWATQQSSDRLLTPFVAAWRLRLFSIGCDSERTAFLGKWLLDLQASDGSWEGTARLRIPIPGDKNPDAYTEWQIGRRSEGGINLDERRIFTTATVISALHVLVSSPYST
jgi:hypothetical protein